MATAAAAPGVVVSARLRDAGARGWSPKFGRSRRSSKQQKLKDKDLVFILRNLATLTESGVPLPKALGTLADERPPERHRDMLLSIRRHLENGETFHSALARLGATFDTVMVSQIKVGEHSGTLDETLINIARHREDSHRLRLEIVRKLAYPILLVVMGSAVIVFLLTYVIPVFKERTTRRMCRCRSLRRC
jgi:type II secretory pathway component PulF